MKTLRPSGVGHRIGVFSVHPNNNAFTLIELVVVLATIAVLFGLFLPALAATHDRSNRAQCQYNLRQIGVVATQYAAENNGTYLSSYNGVPIILYLTNATIAAEIGLQVSNGFWNCPNRLSSLPLENGSFWYIGYQYFGGLSNWNLPVGGRVSSCSPVKLSQAKPYWALAGDAMMKIGPSALSAKWAGIVSIGSFYNFEYNNIPSHPAGNVAQGGNEVFCDGSVQWIDVEKMYGLTSYAGALGNTICYWYQDPKDFSTVVQANLPNLSPMPP